MSWAASDAISPTRAAAGGDAIATLASDALEAGRWRAGVASAGEGLSGAWVARVPSATAVGIAGRATKTRSVFAPPAVGVEGIAATGAREARVGGSCGLSVPPPANGVAGSGQLHPVASQGCAPAVCRHSSVPGPRSVPQRREPFSLRQPSAWKASPRRARAKRAGVVGCPTRSPRRGQRWERPGHARRALVGVVGCPFRRPRMG